MFVALLRGLSTGWNLGVSSSLNSWEPKILRALDSSEPRGLGRPGGGEAWGPEGGETCPQEKEVPDKR